MKRNSDRIAGIPMQFRLTLPSGHKVNNANPQSLKGTGIIQQVVNFTSILFNELFFFAVFFDGWKKKKRIQYKLSVDLT